MVCGTVVEPFISAFHADVSSVLDDGQSAKSGDQGSLQGRGLQLCGFAKTTRGNIGLYRDNGKENGYYEQF